MNAPLASNCVLVVEDEQDARDMMREVVELAGCSVTTAGNGVEALDVLGKVRPCLIIIDLMMPVMDGRQLIEELHKNSSLADIPFIVATSAPHLAPSGTTVITKPVDMKALWGCMQRFCNCPPDATGVA